MTKTKIILHSLALAALACPAFAFSAPIEVKAEGSEEIVSSEVLSNEISSEEIIEPVEEPAYKYLIKDAYIGYRDSEEAQYTKGDYKIGNYFLSAEGWNDESDPIIMTISGNITTKLESKVVYIYEYRPTSVIWNGKEIVRNEDKTYTLEKPLAEGAYDLTINFTKTVITNPVDLTNLNWASLLTVQNLMTIGSWVIIVIGMLVIFFVSRNGKKYTLSSVQKNLSSKIEESFGKDVSEKITNLLNDTVKPIFDTLNDKLAKIDNNNATLVRCLLLMQEDTPESRLAITKCLSELDTSKDDKANEIAKMIEAEIAKYKKESEERQKALEEAEKLNGEWQEKANVKEEIEEVEIEEKKDDFGTL